MFCPPILKQLPTPLYDLAFTKCIYHNLCFQVSELDAATEKLQEMKNLAETEKETIANLRLSKSSEEDLKSHYEKQIKGKYFTENAEPCPNVIGPIFFPTNLFKDSSILVTCVPPKSFLF